MAGETHRQAQVGPALAAGPALTAIVGRVRGDALARERAAHDNAAELVTQDQRPRQPRVADAAFFPPVQVRTAQPYARHAQENLTRTRLRGRLGRHANVARAMDSGRQDYRLRLRHRRPWP